MRGQTPRLNHPEIGRNLGARLQQYNVAGHQFDRLGGGDPASDFAGRQHKAPTSDKFYRGDLGRALLNEPYRRIGEHHPGDNASIAAMFEGEGDHCGIGQDID